jgi:hypothetical protein
MIEIETATSGEYSRMATKIKTSLTVIASDPNLPFTNGNRTGKTPENAVTQARNSQVSSLK